MEPGLRHFIAEIQMMLCMGMKFHVSKRARILLTSSLTGFFFFKILIVEGHIKSSNTKDYLKERLSSKHALRSPNNDRCSFYK